MNSYLEALSTGKVVLRKTWLNENSTKNQVSLQFQQEKPSTGGGSLIAFSQGYSNTQKPTRIWSMSASLVKSLGIPVGVDFTEGKHQIVFANDIFPEEIREKRSIVDKSTGEIIGEEVCDMNIEIIENTTRNPLQPTQTPKMNPSTNEVLKYKGEPIYRHTELVARDAQDSYLEHDKVAAVTQKVSQVYEVSGEPA